MTNTLSKTIVSKVLERAIIHINGDALYASLEQSKHKKYFAKPIVVVNVQGKILSVSKEAHKLGVSMSLSYKELKKEYPTLVLLVRARADYAKYKKSIEKIIRRYTEEVEESGAGSYFADLTGLRTLRKMTYKEMGEHMVKDFYKELGVYIPTALATSKVLAHLGSSKGDIQTLRVINDTNKTRILKSAFVEDIWNISSETIAYLNKLRIYSAYDFMKLPEATVGKVFQTSLIELWKELSGVSVWHELCTPGNDIDYNPSLLKTSTRSNKSSPLATFSLTDTFERLYVRMTSGTSTSLSLASFEERMKRHLVVPYIGKVS